MGRLKARMCSTGSRTIRPGGKQKKKKLTMDMSSNNSSTLTINNNDHNICTDDNKRTTANSIIMPHGLAATSPGLSDVDNNNGGDGAPVYTERSIGESCLYGGGYGSVMDSNMEWVGVEPRMPWVYHYIKEEEAISETREIETLPISRRKRPYQRLARSKSSHFSPPTLENKKRSKKNKNKKKRSIITAATTSYCTQPNGYLPAYLLLDWWPKPAGELSPSLH